MAGIDDRALSQLLSKALNACAKCEQQTDAAEEGRAVDALKVLAQQHVTAELLGKTEAGKRLKRLGKHRFDLPKACGSCSWLS